MDPITQATLGAAAAAALSNRSETKRAVLLGALAAAAPDLDVLIRSDTDPLLALEYHRHFTHSIFVAPIIGIIIAGIFKGIFFWKSWPFKRLALFGVIGSLTHGLLDACTSYGTLLYWPISTHRESWDIISIIDPFFTLPLVILSLISYIFSRPSYARLAITLCSIYLFIGTYQRNKALEFAHSLARLRGHEIDNISARPSLANIVLWRIVYRTDENYYVDALRILPFSSEVHYCGSHVKVYSAQSAAEEFPNNSRMLGDIERFRFFSQDYLYRYPKDNDVIGDLRYAMFPDSIQPLWGIRINPALADRHVSLEYFRTIEIESFSRLFKMIRGQPVSSY